MLDDLIPLSQTFLRIRNRDFKRYFLRDQPLTNRFSIIIGQRGIGKTTVMVQHLLERYKDDRSGRWAFSIDGCLSKNRIYKKHLDIYQDIA